MHLVYSTALVFEKTLVQTAFAVVSCAVPELSEFYSPFCFQLATLGVRHFRRIPAGLENSYSTRHSRRLQIAVVTCADPGLSIFYSLVVSIWQLRVCAIPGAHLLGSIARIQRDIRADCFCSCKLRFCRAECVLLLGFNAHSAIFAVLIAWSLSVFCTSISSWSPDNLKSIQ